MKHQEDFTYLQDATEEELLKFIGEIETAGLLAAPINLKEEIFKQIETEEAKHNKNEKTILEPIKGQKCISKQNKHNKKVELILYSLKVAVAVAVAIFFTSMIEPRTSYKVETNLLTQDSAIQKPKKLTTFLNETTTEICVKLNSFSNNLVRGEWKQ